MDEKENDDPVAGSRVPATATGGRRVVPESMTEANPIEVEAVDPA